MLTSASEHLNFAKAMSEKAKEMCAHEFENANKLLEAVRQAFHPDDQWVTGEISPSSHEPGVSTGAASSSSQRGV